MNPATVKNNAQNSFKDRKDVISQYTGVIDIHLEYAAGWLKIDPESIPASLVTSNSAGKPVLTYKLFDVRKKNQKWTCGLTNMESALYSLKDVPLEVVARGAKVDDNSSLAVPAASLSQEVVNDRPSSISSVPMEMEDNVDIHIGTRHITRSLRVPETNNKASNTANANDRTANINSEISNANNIEKNLNLLKETPNLRNETPEVVNKTHNLRNETRKENKKKPALEPCGSFGFKIVEIPGHKLRSFRSGKGAPEESNLPVDEDGNEILFGHSGSQRLYRRCVVCFKYRDRKSKRITTTSKYCNHCSLPVCPPSKLWTTLSGKTYSCWNELHTSEVFRRKSQRKAQRKSAEKLLRKVKQLKSL